MAWQLASAARLRSAIRARRLLVKKGPRAKGLEDEEPALADQAIRQTCDITGLLP